MKCLNDIIFPEKEIALQQKNAISKLRVSEEKNDYLADVAFKNAVYGKNHPYGYASTEVDILAIQQTLLVQFYTHDIRPDNCTIFIAGKYADNELRLIENYLGSWQSATITMDTNPKEWTATPGEKKIRITKEKSVQASIIIGKELFNKHHEDFAPFLLMNTIFGGYFGSRLMSNIREEKGLTYGIYSGLASLKHGGIFSIQTDTNLDTLEMCMNEIYKEIDRLHQTLIPEREITLARNYLLGKFLSRTDGPFNQVEVFKGYLIEGVHIHKFEEIEESIKQTDAVTLQKMAQTYLQKDSLFETVVG
jgi:predicted Zn-dependent peptidase